MFAKQNQNILSEHYANLLEDDDPSSTKVGPAAGLFDDVGNDDFLTLKRKDHTLAANSDDDDDAPPAGEEVSEADFRAAELSKRKLKMGTSKKAMLKAKGAGHKLVYDADGVAHEIYEFVGEDEELARKRGDEKERFVEEQRREMEVVDVGDREVAKEKKREKKRKRKDREREVRRFLSFVLVLLKSKTDPPPPSFAAFLAGRGYWPSGRFIGRRRQRRRVGRRPGHARTRPDGPHVGLGRVVLGRGG